MRLLTCKASTPRKLLWIHLKKVFHTVEDICIYIYTYTWNPNDPCFDRTRPDFGGINAKNRGQTSLRYLNSKCIQNTTDIFQNDVFKVSTLSPFCHKHIIEIYHTMLPPVMNHFNYINSTRCFFAKSLEGR